jgi:hypothetical protein
LETDRAQRAPSGLFKAVPLHSAFPNRDLVEP